MVATVYSREVEVERVNNVARNLGWELVKQEMVGEDLHITFKKPFPAPVGIPTEGEAG